MHSRYIAGAGGIVENVEQPAVEDGFKSLAEGADPKHVQDLEAGIDAAIGGFATGDPDGSRGDVDAYRFGVVTGSEDGVLAGAAAGIEQCASEQARLGEADEGRLRAANVPRRRRSGIGTIPIVRGVGCGHVPHSLPNREQINRHGVGRSHEWKGPYWHAPSGHAAPPSGDTAGNRRRCPRNYRVVSIGPVLLIS